MNPATLMMLAVACQAGHAEADRIRVKGVNRRTHICGFDNGKSKRVPQPRNALCQCGSGKKAKRCCIWVKQSNEES